MMHASSARLPARAIGLPLAAIFWLAAGSSQVPEQKERAFELPFPAGKSYDEVIERLRPFARSLYNL